MVLHSLNEETGGDVCSCTGILATLLLGCVEPWFSVNCTFERRRLEIHGWNNIEEFEEVIKNVFLINSA